MLVINIRQCPLTIEKSNQISPTRCYGGGNQTNANMDHMLQEDA